MSKDAARAARARRPAHPDLRLRPPRHPVTGQIDRRVLATLSSSPPRASSPTCRPLKCGHSLPDQGGDGVRAHLRQRRRHRGGQRHPDPRPPGPGLDHRHHHPAPAHAPGHDEAPPDHHPDELPGRRQHARRWPTTPTTSTSASTRCIGASSKLDQQYDSALKPGQWIKLIDRLNQIDNPVVPVKPSKVAIPTGRPAAPTVGRVAPLADANQRFRFVQFEFPWALGPDDGRYVAAPVAGGGAQPRAGAAPRSARPSAGCSRGRRPQRAEPEPDPTPVPTARATVIAATGAPRPRPTAWLAGRDDDARTTCSPSAWPCSTARSTPTAWPAADPWLQDVHREHALVARLGYGSGEQVAEGRWAAAVEVPLGAPPQAAARRGAAPAGAPGGAARRPRRAAGLPRRWRCAPAPTSTPAASREAALQLRVALEAGDRRARGRGAADDMAEAPRRAARAAAAPVGAAANAALEGPLGARRHGRRAASSGRLEAALRARSAAGFE